MDGVSQHGHLVLTLTDTGADVTGDPGLVARARFTVPPETDGLWHDLREGLRSLGRGRTHVPRSDFDLVDADGERRVRITRPSGTSLALDLVIADTDGGPLGRASTDGMTLAPNPEVVLRNASDEVVARFEQGAGILVRDDDRQLAAVLPSVGSMGLRGEQAWTLRFVGDVPEATRTLVVAALIGMLSPL